MFISSSSLRSGTCTLFIHNNHKSHPKVQFFSNPNPAVSNRHLCSFWANPTFSYLRTGPTIQTQNRRSEMDFVVDSNNQPGDDLNPLRTLLHSWTNWIPGILATIILVPFLAKEWGQFTKLKEEVDTVEETVIKVAEKVERVVEDITDDLPKDKGGKFKNALIYVDHIAKQAAKDAQLAEDIINKVEGVEEEVESLVDSIDDSDKTKPTPKQE